jgi:hypothetical protein
MNSKYKNEPQILKEHQISKEIQIRNKPQILKDRQISNVMQSTINTKLQKKPKFPKNPKL